MGGFKQWVDGFINIKDMHNNDVGKGGVWAYEAHEAKQRVALVRGPFYFINLLPTSLLYISILLTRANTSIKETSSQDLKCVKIVIEDLYIH